MTLRKHNLIENMANPARLKLSIHHSNLFQPKPPAIKNIAIGFNKDYIAVTRQHTDNRDLQQPLTTIVVYRMNVNAVPKVIFTIIEHEELTGIVWISAKLILTVSKQQTINMYSIKVGSKVLSIITDYGPILCMNYIARESLLFTGTEYGYIATYRVEPSSIEPVDKMVKTNGPINSLGLKIHSKKKAKRVKSGGITPPPSKKHKLKDTNSSGNETSDESEDEEPIDNLDVDIYGACRSEVIAWDYHKKTIVDTIHVSEDSNCNVLSLLVLRNGNVVTGDSNGMVSIFDQHTYTCRQSTKFLQHGVLSLAKDSRSHHILASGEDPAIVVLKLDKSQRDNYIIFEKIELHTHDVNTITYIKENEFITGGNDGLIGFYKIKRADRLIIQKFATLPNYSNNVKFCGDEIMTQYDRELVIWKIPRNETVPDSDDYQEKPKLNPVKLLLLKSRTFIHSSTFNERWICYSTKKDLHIFSRSRKDLVSYRPEKKLPDCTLTELCFGGDYLAACAQGKLFLIELKEQQMKNGTTDKTSFKCRIIVERELGPAVRNLVDFKSMNFLVALCGTLSSAVYTFKLNLESEKLLEKVKKISFKQREISFLTYNGAVSEDLNIYAFTDHGQVFKFNPSSEGPKDILNQLDGQNGVEGLPTSTCILGMVVLSEHYCILYDSNQMYKVDIAANKVVNQNTNYSYIIKMDNSTFDDANQVALVELTPADYRANLPLAKPRKKFGQHT